ncbi:hypothetical protein ABH925_001196 [Streptacidiphilus sp. EB129]
MSGVGTVVVACSAVFVVGGWVRMAVNKWRHRGGR